MVRTKNSVATKFGAHKIGRLQQEHKIGSAQNCNHKIGSTSFGSTQNWNHKIEGAQNCNHKIESAHIGNT